MQKNYSSSWDETPIKPASKQQMDTYFGDAIAPSNSGYAPPARSNNVAMADSPRKHSMGDRTKGFMERRRSSDSSDGQPVSDPNY